MKTIVVLVSINIILSIFNFAYATKAEPVYGVRPKGICTRDINEWGNPSICHCDAAWIYDKRAYLCIPENSKLPLINVQGSLILDPVAVGGEITHALLVSSEGSYELITKRETLSKLKELQNIDQLVFAVEGELIYQPSMIADRLRPSLVVLSIKVLQSTI